MSDEVKVGDRFEALKDVPLAIRRGDLFEAKRLLERTAISTTGIHCSLKALVSSAFRRLPREDAAPKLPVPRVAERFEDLKPGMRVRWAWCRSFQTSRDGEGVLSAGRRVTWLEARADNGGDNAEFAAGHLNHFELITILADPEEPATKPPALHGQALINHVEKREPAARPCPTHNMPLPCVECGLNARYAAEQGRDEVAKMLGRERYRQMGERLHASLPVLRPWALMDGVQGPGWNRREGLK